MTNSKLLQSVIDDLQSREQRGKSKYGTTMDRSDLNHKEWLQHAYEEALDMALYLKKAIGEGGNSCMYCMTKISNGRTDKKFCSDFCKNTYHNRKSK